MARCRVVRSLTYLGLTPGTKDGRFAVDFWADNVGFDNQRYKLSSCTSPADNISI